MREGEQRNLVIDFILNINMPLRTINKDKLGKEKFTWIVVEHAVAVIALVRRGCGRGGGVEDGGGRVVVI